MMIQLFVNSFDHSIHSFTTLPFIWYHSLLFIVFDSVTFPHSRFWSISSLFWWWYHSIRFRAIPILRYVWCSFDLEVFDTVLIRYRPDDIHSCSFWPFYTGRFDKILFTIHCFLTLPFWKKVLGSTLFVVVVVVPTIHSFLFLPGIPVCCSFHYLRWSYIRPLLFLFGVPFPTIHSVPLCSFSLTVVYYILFILFVTTCYRYNLHTNYYVRYSISPRHSPFDCWFDVHIWYDSHFIRSPIHYVHDLRCYHSTLLLRRLHTFICCSTFYILMHSCLFYTVYTHYVHSLLPLSIPVSTTLHSLHRSTTTIRSPTLFYTVFLYPIHGISIYVLRLHFHSFWYHYGDVYVTFATLRVLFLCDGDLINSLISRLPRCCCCSVHSFILGRYTTFLTFDSFYILGRPTLNLHGTVYSLSISFWHSDDTI